MLKQGNQGSSRVGQFTVKNQNARKTQISLAPSAQCASKIPDCEVSRNGSFRSEEHEWILTEVGLSLSQPTVPKTCMTIWSLYTMMVKAGASVSYTTVSGKQHLVPCFDVKFDSVRAQLK